MKKSIFNFTTLITPFLLTCAFPLTADTTHIQAGIGYRQDSITLDVKERPSSNPRAKSNRHYKDLQILLLGAQLKTTLGSCDAYIRGSFDYGFVLDGKLRDHLVIRDRNEISKIHHGSVSEGKYLSSTVHNNIKSDSFVWDVDLAFAYPVPCDYAGLEIAPAVGFSIDRQQLYVDGFKCEESDFASTGFDMAKKHGHRSSLRGSWWSPWLGFDFAYNAYDCWDVYGTFEFHIGRARRKVGSHSDRKNVDNYTHTKTFYGPLFKLGTIYKFCENWYADANITYWKYFSDTSRDHLAWASGSIRLDVGYEF